MTKKIAIANWKMNKSFDEAENWLKNLLGKINSKSSNNLPELVLCPPAILLDYLDESLMSDEFEKINKMQKKIDQLDEEELEKLISELRIVNLGAQDCHYEISGSYTGDISGMTLKDAGCKYVIIGHSERRKYHFESDQIIAKKILAALQSELIPILCLGESEQNRKEGKYLNFIKNQLEAALGDNLTANEIIIAYEPIWSIGTGIIPNNQQIIEVIKLIKDFLQTKPKIKKSRVLYGGSVKQDNAEEICQIDNLDGLLLGGSSLNEDEFLTIAKFLVTPET